MLFHAWNVPSHVRFAVVFALCATFAGLNIVVGQSSTDVTRIEEDWAVTIVEPSSAITAPQFTAVMTPDHNDQSIYCTVEFNHSTSPDFQAGGIQLQTWADGRMDDASRLRENSLSTNNEQIRWTQFMELKDGSLEFGLTNIQSDTWKKFTGYDYNWLDTHLTLTTTPMPNLNNYRVSDSVDSSAVGFAANRVSSMVLVQVRVYVGANLVQTIDVNHDLRSGSGGSESSESGFAN